MGQILLQVCSDLLGRLQHGSSSSSSSRRRSGEAESSPLTDEVVDSSAAKPTDLIQSSSGTFHKLTIVKQLDWNPWPRDSTFKGRPHPNRCTLVSTTHHDRIPEDIGLESLVTDQDSTFKSHPHSNIFSARHNRWIS